MNRKIKVVYYMLLSRAQIKPSINFKFTKIVYSDNVWITIEELNALNIRWTN